MEINSGMLNSREEEICGRTIVLRLCLSGSNTDLFVEIKSGVQLFKSFRSENSSSFWDPHLQESVESLRYVGLLRPCTILIGGEDLALDTIAASWSRRTLLPPNGYSIHSLGIYSNNIY